MTAGADNEHAEIVCSAGRHAIDCLLHSYWALRPEYVQRKVNMISALKVLITFKQNTFDNVYNFASK